MNCLFSRQPSMQPPVTIAKDCSLTVQEQACVQLVVCIVDIGSCDAFRCIWWKNNLCSSLVVEILFCHLFIVCENCQSLFVMFFSSDMRWLHHACSLDGRPLTDITSLKSHSQGSCLSGDQLSKLWNVNCQTNCITWKMEIFASCCFILNQQGSWLQPQDIVMLDPRSRLTCSEQRLFFLSDAWNLSPSDFMFLYKNVVVLQLHSIVLKPRTNVNRL